MARTHQWGNIGRLVRYVVQLFAAFSTLRISGNYVLGNPLELFDGKANKSLKASSDLEEIIHGSTYIFLVEVFLHLVDKITGHESIQ